MTSQKAIRCNKQRKDNWHLAREEQLFKDKTGKNSMATWDGKPPVDNNGLRIDGDDDDEDDYSDDDMDSDYDEDDEEYQQMQALMETMREEKEKNQQLANTLIRIHQQKQQRKDSIQKQGMFHQILSLTIDNNSNKEPPPSTPNTTTNTT